MEPAALRRPGVLSLPAGERVAVATRLLGRIVMGTILGAPASLRCEVNTSAILAVLLDEDDAYLLEAARTSGFPLLTLDRRVQRHARKLGLSLVELDL